MAIPTRSDRLVATLSEVVGGPLGSHAGHHPWWSPQRVLLAVTAVALAAGMLLKSPCAGSSWSGAKDPYAHLCWTEVAGNTAAGRTTPWAASYLTRADLPISLIAILLAVIALSVTRLLVRSDLSRPWAAAGWAASPLLAVHWLSWDFLAAAGVALALWGWLHRQPIATGVGGFVAVAFSHPVVSTSEPDVGSVWLLLEQWRDAATAQNVRLLVSGVVVALAVAAAVFVVRRGAGAATATARALLIVAAAILIVAPSATPEAALILLPLAALAGLRWRDLLVWQGAELVFWAATGWYLAGVLAPSTGPDADAYWFAILLRVAGLVWLVVACLRSGDVDDVEVGRGEPHPHRDLLTDAGHPGAQG